MSTDNEVTITIKAVDEYSDTLNSISKSTDNFASDTEVNQNSISDSFKVSTNSLLALGNTASEVDHIFMTYENTQIRLENAVNRLDNAQQTLSDKQEALNKLQSSGTATADQLAKAHDDVARAMRGVDTAQNNLQRTQNMVIGAYINMGVQAVSLVAQIPQLIATFEKLAATLEAVSIEEAITAALANPVALGLGLAAAAAGVYAIHSLSVASSTASMNAQLSNTNSYFPTTASNISSIGTSADSAYPKVDKLTESLNKQYFVMSKGQIDLLNGGLGGAPFSPNPNYNPYTTDHGPGTPSAPAGMFYSQSRGGFVPIGDSSSNNVIKVGDAIIRPNGQIIETNPNDTLIATQNPGAMGGMTIVIQGDNYGIDASAIATALFDKLRRKIVT